MSNNSQGAALIENIATNKGTKYKVRFAPLLFGDYWPRKRCAAGRAQRNWPIGGRAPAGLPRSRSVLT